MRLILHRDLFDLHDQNEAVALANLFSTIATHQAPSPALMTDPLWNPETDNGPIDAWLAQRPGMEASAFRQALATGLLVNTQRSSGTGLSAEGNLPHWHIEGSLTIHVERRFTSDWKNQRLTLTDAADLVREPLHLLLENSRNDLTFLKHLAGPTDGQTFLDLEAESRRLEVFGGGCGEIQKWLEELKTQETATQISSAWRKLLRTWVMFDRDAGDQDALQPSTHALKLLELLKGLHDDRGMGPSWVCLERREIESYVPDEGLRQAAGQQQKVFAEKVIDWRGDPDRTPWAWALDLKNGLRGDLRADLAKQTREDINENRIALAASMLKSPFNTLGSEDVRLLERGFGKRRLRDGMGQNPQPEWVNAIPAEYDRGPSGQAPRLELIQSLFDRV